MYSIDYNKFSDIEYLRDKYASADPYSHIVIDDFLTEENLQKIIKEFPSVDSSYWYEKNVATSKKFDSRRRDKELFLSENLRILMWELNSYRFLSILSDISGIKNLLPDPTLEGGGPHMITSGGYLKVHIDFNKHPLYPLQRRLNVLLYLNQEWDDSWGGQLELWTGNGLSCGKKISPKGNRIVIFETTDHSWHGHPMPLKCPENVQRKSIAAYYYTLPTGIGLPHNTIYRKS